jgi:hypothetical protein
MLLYLYCVYIYRDYLYIYMLNTIFLLKFFFLPFGHIMIMFILPWFYKFSVSCLPQSRDRMT